MVLTNPSSSKYSRRRLLQLTAGGASLTGLNPVSGQPEDDFVDIISTDSTDYPDIGVNIRVDTEAGRNGDLTTDDFAIYENGVQKKIKEFSFGNTALDIVFVFDDSGSMGNEIATMKRETKSLTSQIANQGIDAQYGLVSFRDRVQEDLSLTNDANELKQAVDNLEASGGGDFPEDNFDAIETALDMDFRDGAETIIVDITDATAHYEGDGSGYSEYTLSEVAEDIREAGAVFVGVSGGFDDPKASLKVLANKSNGKWYDIYSADFDDLLENIIEFLVQIYYVSYETSQPQNSEQTVSAEVDDPNRGKDLEKALLEIEPEAGPTPAERFNELVDAKRTMASYLDEFSISLNESPFVNESLDDLETQLENDNIDPTTAGDAVERMMLAEDITELSLGVINPNTVTPASEIGFDNLDPYSKRYEPKKSAATKENAQLAKTVAQNVINLAIALVLVSRGIKWVAGKVNISIGSADKRLNDALTILKSIPIVASEITDIIYDFADTFAPQLRNESKTTDEVTDEAVSTAADKSNFLGRTFSSSFVEDGFEKNLEGVTEGLNEDALDGSLEGSNANATEAWKESRQLVREEYQETRDELNVTKAIAKTGTLISTAGIALSFVGGPFAAVGVFATVVGALFGLGFTFLTAVSSQDGIYRIRGMHNAGVDAIAGGEAYVDY